MHICKFVGDEHRTDGGCGVSLSTDILIYCIDSLSRTAAASLHNLIAFAARNSDYEREIFLSDWGEHPNVALARQAAESTFRRTRESRRSGQIDIPANPMRCEQTYKIFQFGLTPHYESVG